MLFLVIGLFELLVMKSTGYGIEKQQRERYNRDPLKDLVSIYLVFSYYNSRESLRWHRCQWCFWWQENNEVSTVVKELSSDQFTSGGFMGG